MSSLHLPEAACTDRIADLALPGPPSAIARFILVAGLAGFGIVALAMHDGAPTARPAAATATLVGGFVDDGSNDPEVQLALLADEQFFRTRAPDSAAAADADAIRAPVPVVVAATATVPDGYLPARLAINPWAAEGNVPTYEHD